MIIPITPKIMKTASGTSHFRRDGMNQKKMMEHISKLNSQRLRLNEAIAGIQDSLDRIKQVKARSTNEMINMELDGLMEALRRSKSRLEESMDLNETLDDELKKPDIDDLLNKIKGIKAPKAAEEYEEI